MDTYGETREDHYESHLEPYLKLAVGIPWEIEAERALKRARGELAIDSSLLEEDNMD